MMLTIIRIVMMYYYRTNLGMEIAICRNKLDMSWNQIGQCFIRGAQAAFIDDPQQKKALIDTVTRRVNVWVAKQKQISAEQAHQSQVRKGMLKTGILAGWAVMFGLITKWNTVIDQN